MTAVDVVVGVVSVAGALLVALAGVGVVRLADLYARMHAATKAPTAGLGLIGLAAVVAVDGGAAKVALAVVMIFVTVPSAAHLIGRAAYRAEGIDVHLDGPDDLSDLLDDPDAG